MEEPQVIVIEKETIVNQGPKGDKGDKGDSGNDGEQGIQGNQGAAGAKGDKGDKGEPGNTGATGAKGDKGDPAITPVLLSLDYPATVTLGNTLAKIIAVLKPTDILQNILFLKRTDKQDAVAAVDCATGAISPIAVGAMQVDVIPTGNTQLRQVAAVQVVGSYSLTDENDNELTDENGNILCT